MKKILLLVIAITLQVFLVNSQTADEIIANYFENTGGLENWAKLEGIKMSAKVNQGGMEIPLEITQLKNGNQMTVINFQGLELKQGVFDGEVCGTLIFRHKKLKKVIKNLQIT